MDDSLSSGGAHPTGLPPHIGRYAVARELGRGGMGVVYEGVDPGLGRRVAIKVLLHGGEQTAEDLARFEREARTVARLDHESIVRVFDVGVERGRPFIVMEYVEGQDLHQALKRGVARETTLGALRDTAEALAAAHAAGIVHRDVKPENILIRGDTGRGALLDFGVAKVGGVQGLTQTGALVGTPDYMAPEQLDGETSTASDVYALGATLYDILCGRPPFLAKSMIELLTMITTDRIEPPSQHAADVPPDLEALTMACLEANPEDRPTADVVARELSAYLADPTDEAVAPRGSWLLPSAVVVALAVCGGLLAWALTRESTAGVAAKTNAPSAPARPAPPSPTALPSPAPQPTRSTPPPPPPQPTEILGEISWSKRGGPRGIVPNGKWSRRPRKIVNTIGRGLDRMGFRFVLAEEGIEWAHLRLRHNASNLRGQPKWSKVGVWVTPKNPTLEKPGKEEDALVTEVTVERNSTRVVDLTPIARLHGGNRIRIRFVDGPSTYRLLAIEIRYGRGKPPTYESWPKRPFKRR